MKDNYSTIIDNFLDKHNDIKLFVFDFDQTLTKSPTLVPKMYRGTVIIKSKFQAPIKPSVLYNAISDPDFIRAFVLAVVKRGKGVAIASYNDRTHRVTSDDLTGYPLIKTTLDLIFPDRPGLFGKHNIIAYYPRHPYRVGKAVHLKVLSKRYLLAPEEILLFDDNRYNVRRALEDNYNAYLVPTTGKSPGLTSALPTRMRPSGGFTEEYIAKMNF